VTEVDDQQKALIQVIYDQLRARGVWPSFDQIDRPLRRAGVDPVRTIRQMPDTLMPPNWGRIVPAPNDPMHLTIQGIALADGGMEDVNWFLRLLPWFADKELSFEPGAKDDEKQLWVTRAEIVRFLELDESSTAPSRVLAILNQERWGGSGSWSGNGDYKIYVAREVSRFAGVRSLDDYSAVLADLDRENKRSTPPVQMGSVMFTNLNPVTHSLEPEDGTFPQDVQSEDTFVTASVVQAIEEGAADSKFECSKLIQLISELNQNYANRNTYAAHTLLRAVLDHIPPILGFRTFDEVVNNYGWSRTDKQYMSRLRDFRAQGDDALHQPISPKLDLLRFDDLPSGAGLNVLLRECAENL
jgi:hypothetical protein